MAGKFKYYSISTAFILFSSLFWWKDVADLVRQEIFKLKSLIWWKNVVLSKNDAILKAKPHFTTK